MNKPNQLTFDQEVEALYQQMRASSKPKPKAKPVAKPKPVPKPAMVRAAERWQAKPVEVKLLDATAQNEEVVDHLREARQRDTQLAYKQAILDGYWQSILNAREAVQEYVGYHRGRDDSDWGL
jgi:hypothetical protein